MRIFLTITLLLSMVVTANSETDKTQSSAQTAIDKIMADLSNTLGEMTVIDESDKKLALSNRAQIDTTEMLKKTENRIKHEDIPALQQRSSLADQKRQEAIESGCPEHGGTVSRAVYDRCESQSTAYNKEHDQILQDAQHIKDQLATIETTRQAVSETTLANAKQQKANNARRAELEAKKAALKSQLITLAISASTDKAKAANSCKSLSGEQAACCLSVVWDGANPERCGVELIYQVFEKAGIFSTTIIKPKVSGK